MFEPSNCPIFISSSSSSSSFSNEQIDNRQNKTEYNEQRTMSRRNGPGPHQNYSQNNDFPHPMLHGLSHPFGLLFLCLLLICPSFGSDVRQRRSPPNSVAGGELALPQECYHQYGNTDHHSSLLHWLQRKNASHYSPISPSYQQALLKLQAQEVAHGLQVTSGASSCNTRKLKAISATTPLRERALCQFEYILNYNPQRIPSTFTEVKCSCQKPSVRMVGNRMFECEPLRYQVRVLLFDPQCLTYVEQTETIALACLPVLQANTNAESGESDEEIQVPAAPYPSYVPT